MLISAAPERFLDGKKRARRGLCSYSKGSYFVADLLSVHVTARASLKETLTDLYGTTDFISFIFIDRLRKIKSMLITSSFLSNAFTAFSPTDLFCFGFFFKEKKEGSSCFFLDVF